MKNEIFEKMHEKMTPREETVQELFAKAEASSYSVLSESHDGHPSADNTGGIIMSMNNNTNGTKISEVRNHRAGFAVAAAAALVLAVGAGAYGLHKSTLDDIKADKTAGSATASSQTEEVSSDTASEAGAGAADSSGMSVSVEDAKARVSYLEAIKAQPEDLEAYAQTLSIGEPETETDSGVECYVFNDVNGTTYYVPTGKVEDTGEPDTFMTELAAGQALTDAGIGHTEFDVLGVTVKRTAADGVETIEGVQIDFVAKALYYSYYIDNMGEIKSSSRTDARKYGHILTEEEAMQRAMKLVGYDKMPVLINTSLDTEGGVECYEFTCRKPDAPNETIIFYVPTGRVTPSDDTEDLFMTKTPAGMVLSDAGIAHDGFVSLCVFTMHHAGPFDHDGLESYFIANGKLYDYMIDAEGTPSYRSSVPLSNFSRFRDEDYFYDVYDEAAAAEKQSIDIKSLSPLRKVYVSDAAELNGFTSDMLDVTEIDASDYFGEYAYNITFTLQEPWRRYPEDGTEYTVHLSIEEDDILPRIGEADAKISLEEAERIVMEQKGFTKDDLYDREFFNEGLEYFGGELAYVFSYEVDINVELVSAEAKGKHYPYNFGIQTAIVSAETGDILRRTAMTEYEAKQKALEFVDPTLASGVEKFPKPEVEVESVNYDSANPNERYNFVCRLEGYDTKCHVIVPTGSIHGLETDEDPYENEPVIAKALEDAVIGDDEYDILACAEDESGSRVRFGAHGMIFSYVFDKSGNIVVKQCANGGGINLAESDMTEYEARRTVLRQLGYTLADPNEFSAYSGTNDEGEHGWIFEFSAGGKSYKYFVVYKENAADASERFILKDMS